MVRPVRVLGPGGRGHTLLRASSCSVVTPRAATQWISSPSKRNTPTYAQSQSRLALSAIAWATGCKSVGDSRITRRISLVAVCCSRASASRLSACAVSLRASARRFSTSPSPEPSSLGDLRPTRGLASLDLVGFRPRRIGLPLPPINGPGTGYGQPVCRGKGDRKSTRLNSSHVRISYAVFYLKKKKKKQKKRRKREKKIIKTYSASPDNR